MLIFIDTKKRTRSYWKNFLHTLCLKENLLYIRAHRAYLYIGLAPVCVCVFTQLFGNAK